MSAQQIDVKELERKSVRFIEQDGLGAIFMGLIFTGWGLALQSTGIVFVIPLIAPFLFSRFYGVLKQRYTYPRTGFAQFPQDDPKKAGIGMAVFNMGVMAVFVFCLFLFGDVTDPALYRKWSPTFTAVMLLGGFIYLHSKTGGAGPWVYAVVTIGLGLLFSILEFDGYDGASYWCLSLGAFLILYGIINFLLFLHRYPMPAAEVTNGEK